MTFKVTQTIYDSTGIAVKTGKDRNGQTEACVIYGITWEMVPSWVLVNKRILKGLRRKPKDDLLASERRKRAGKL